MYKNLVIVESPAKAKTIERFLGKEYKVTSSYGHVRDLKKHDLSIDKRTMEPIYEVPEEKRNVVEQLRKLVKSSEQVWLASDEDREGEAISWHLCEVLGLDEQTTQRIVFHEITKPAIVAALQSPRHIDMNLVNAQQARRILDRMVGFRLSPVLWRKVKPALSAGRVQSVAVRLIVERERELQAFKSDRYFRVTALFDVLIDGKNNTIRAELATRFKTEEEAKAFLERCAQAQFTVSDIQTKPLSRTPAPPFTTSTLQQEAARKLGFTVNQTMMVAQHLYESGLITYMRTDSVNLSSLCINACKNEISTLYGERYSKPRHYRTHSKGAQEAHEAIRPTAMERQEISGTAQERRLYELIWKRTLACQMADAEIDKTSVSITGTTISEQFMATGEVIRFDGFLKVYRESTDDDIDENEQHTMLPALELNMTLEGKEITATERFSQPPLRYTEASLVKKMEELGIGRPSTYAPTISTIQQREYVTKGDKAGSEQTYTILTLKNGKMAQHTKKEIIGKEKGKLLPTDVGLVVNDFLMQHFPAIMDYNFTARVEEQFDHIAEGKEDWHDMMQQFDKDFEPEVDKVMKERTTHKAGERQIGVDPKSGKPVFVKIGRFGPVVQIGNATDEEKPRFAQLPKNKSMDTLTLEDALELFQLPRTLGQLDGDDVVVGTGRFGPYVLHKKVYTSIPKGTDPMQITLSEATQLINEKHEEQQKRHLRQFSEDPELEIMNGHYGLYLSYKGSNYRLPKKYNAQVDALTFDDCMKIIEESQKKK